MLHGADYIIGKTSNKSMLAHINQMVLHITTYNLRYGSYDDIATTVHEDIFMDWFYKSKGQKDYRTPLQYWMKELGEHPSL